MSAQTSPRVLSLSRIVSDQNNLFLNLEGESLKTKAIDVINRLHKELQRHDDLPDELAFRSRRLLEKLVLQHSRLPRDLYIDAVPRPSDSQGYLVDYLYEGGYGQIYPGELKGQKVAIKRITPRSADPDEHKRMFLREALMLSELRHKHIVPLLGVSDAVMGLGDSPCMIFPWYPNGTLKDAAAKDNTSVYDLAKWTLQLMAGLQYLHCHLVVHGDMCARNTLLDDAGDVRIIDFGLSRLSQNTLSMTQTSGAGSLRWMAPEAFLLEGDEQLLKLHGTILSTSESGPPVTITRKSTASDVWALACTIYEIYEGKEPYHRYSHDMQVLFALHNKELPALTKPLHMPALLWKDILRCWAIPLSERPSVDILLATLRVQGMNAALMRAVWRNNLSIVKQLVVDGVSLDDQDNHSWTLLMVAAKYGHLAVIEHLVAHGASLDIQTKKGRTALTIAAEQGHMSVVEHLVAQGASLDMQRNDGWTPLMIAAHHDHWAIVEHLAVNGASLDMQNKNGRTALTIGAQKGNLSVVEHLVAHGASLQKQIDGGWTALIFAAEKGHLSVVKHLVAQGVSLDMQKNDGWTPLMIAAHYGHLSVVEHLSAKGASLDMQTETGGTALIIGVQNGHLSVVKHLVACGASLDMQTKKGNTALIIGAQNGHLAIVKHLVVLGASLAIRDHDGRTAVMLAKGHPPVLEYLAAQQQNKIVPSQGTLTFLRKIPIFFGGAASWSNLGWEHARASPMGHVSYGERVVLRGTEQEILDFLGCQVHSVL